MAQRYVSSVGWDFLGDVSKAQQYVPFARTLIGSEIERAELLRLEYRNVTKKYENGLVIKINTILHLNSPYLVRCTIDVRLVQPEDDLLPLLHGLADPQVGTLPGFEDNHYKNSAGAPALNRFYPKDGTAWVQEKELAQNKTNSEAAASFHDKIPGKYSGEMRRVVQDIVSRGQECFYEYTFATTHGIFTSSTGTKWVIEITSGGIRAHLLLTKGNAGAGNLLNSLDYVPVPQELTDVSWHSLSVSGAFATAYSYSPLFAECGWAFSYDGSEASTVVIQNRTDAPSNPGGSYSYGRLYTITITEDSEQKPMQASVAEVEADWIWCNNNATFKYPSYFFDSLVSFDSWHPFAPPDTSGTTSGPFHCWYDTDGALQVCRLGYDQGSSTVVNDPLPGLLGHPDPAPFPYGSFTSGTGQKSSLQSPIFPAYLENLTLSGSTRTDFVTWKEISGMHAHASTSYTYSDDIAITGIKTRTNPDDAISSKESISIPLNDRESVFHFRQETTTVKDDGTSYLKPIVPYGYDGNGYTIQSNADPVYGGGADCYKVYACDCLGEVLVLGYNKGFYETPFPGSQYHVLTGATTWETAEEETVLSCWPNGLPAGDPGRCDESCPTKYTKWWRDLIFINPAAYTYTEAAQDTTTITNDIKVITDGTHYTLELGDADGTAWLRYVDDPENSPQKLMSTPDMSGTITPIYTELPSPDLGLIPAVLAGPAAYPYTDIDQTFPSWVGNPGDAE